MKQKDVLLFLVGLWILAGGAFLISRIGWRWILVVAFVVPPFFVSRHYLRRYRLGGMAGSAIAIGVYLGFAMLLMLLGFVAWSINQGEWQTIRWLRWDYRYLLLVFPACLFTWMVAKRRKAKDPLFLIFLFVGMVFWSSLLWVLVAVFVGIGAALVA